MRCLVLAVVLLGCSSAPIETGTDASSAADAAPGNDATASSDVGALDVVQGEADADGGCFVSTTGVFGECITTSDCAALGNHTSVAGYCPGPTDIECCTLTPSVTNNPPVPTGWVLMQQANVTPAMTNWAVAILQDPTTYPMFSTTTQMFGSLNVMARVEWHPPDFQNSAIHRGVTLYQPG